MEAIPCSQTRVVWENHILEDLMLIFLATDRSDVALFEFCIVIILGEGSDYNFP